MSTVYVPKLDREVLREAIVEEYEAVACTPEQGFHFNTGRPHALKLGYRDEWLEGVPASSISSFAGTGNPFEMAELKPGSTVVDVGSGAGIDSLIAARMVGPEGRVIGVDMTPSMVRVAREAAEAAGLGNVEFRQGYGEELPVEDGWADVVISNGVMNLMPDKDAAYGEVSRVLRSGGGLQIADIILQKAVPENAKDRIELWSG
jgi:SAM-dependent methyltransferase